MKRVPQVLQLPGGSRSRPYGRDVLNGGPRSARTSVASRSGELASPEIGPTLPTAPFDELVRKVTAHDHDSTHPFVSEERRRTGTGGFERRIPAPGSGIVRSGAPLDEYNESEHFSRHQNRAGAPSSANLHDTPLWARSLCRTAQTGRSRGDSIVNDVTLLLIIIASAILAVLAIATVRERRAANSPNLGFVTERWLTEYRAEQPGDSR